MATLVDGLQRAFAVFVGIDGASIHKIQIHVFILFRKGHLSIYVLMVFLVMNQMPTLRSQVSPTNNGFDTYID